MLSTILLQIVTNQDNNLTTLDSQNINILDLLIRGGWVMLPIVLLWIIALYIFIERVLTIKKSTILPDGFMVEIKKLVERGKISEARMLCAQTNSSVSKMIEKGLSRIGSPLKNIEVSIENVGKIEIFKLEKNLSLLATISGSAPMIGFLGTVIGMIKAFIAIAQEEGSVSPKLLSEGIYTAMITTAAGLVVGILAYLGYNYLVTRVQKIIHRMEYSTIEFIDLLQEPKS